MRTDMLFNRQESNGGVIGDPSWVEGVYLIGLGSVFFEAVMLSLALYIIR